MIRLLVVAGMLVLASVTAIIDGWHRVTPRPRRDLLERLDPFRPPSVPDPAVRRLTSR